MPINNSFTWITGEKAQLAKDAGISQQQLADILADRLKVSVKRALALEVASASVLGEDRRIPAGAWLRIADHPALRKV